MMVLTKRQGDEREAKAVCLQGRAFISSCSICVPPVYVEPRMRLPRSHGGLYRTGLSIVLLWQFFPV